jgi:hypothetical protein
LKKEPFSNEKNQSESSFSVSICLIVHETISLKIITNIKTTKRPKTMFCFSNKFIESLLLEIEFSPNWLLALLYGIFSLDFWFSF